jgi:iron complex outermembrane receptor protein
VTRLSAGLEYRRETLPHPPGRAGQLRQWRHRSRRARPARRASPASQPVIGGQRVDQSASPQQQVGLCRARRRRDRGVQPPGRRPLRGLFGLRLRLERQDRGRFEPVEGLALRASASTGFRAPSLQQQFFAAQATNNVNGVLLETVTCRSTIRSPSRSARRRSMPSTSDLLFGRPGLHAVPRLNVTIDAYQVEIDDRIVVTDNLTATRDAPQPPRHQSRPSIATILNAGRLPATNAARFFVNGVDTRTRGLDFVATYRFRRSAAAASTSPAASTTTRPRSSGCSPRPGRWQRPGPGPVRPAGIAAPDRGPAADQDQLSPRLRARLVRRHRCAPPATARCWTRAAERFHDVELEAKWITDLELRFKPLGDRLRVRARRQQHLRRLPDQDPDRPRVDPGHRAARAFRPPTMSRRSAASRRSASTAATSTDG